MGNHTFNHLNGWANEDAVYLENIRLCQEMISPPGSLAGNQPLPLFRPPYGKIKSSQFRQIRRDYQIIMWDVLSYDFDRKLPPEICLQKTIRYTRPGSIVLFHDSLKSERSMAYALPRYLGHFSSLGYTFAAL